MTKSKPFEQTIVHQIRRLRKKSNPSTRSSRFVSGENLWASGIEELAELTLATEIRSNHDKIAASFQPKENDRGIDPFVQEKLIPAVLKHLAVEKRRHQ